MNKARVIAASVAIAVLATPFSSAVAATKESVGLGIGGIVGAVAGGPVGFIIGAASGAVVGDRWSKAEHQAASADAALLGAQQQIAMMEHEIDALGADLDALGTELVRYQADPAATALELLRAGVELDVLFRTDEDTAPASTRQRLEELGQVLATVPNVYVSLDGYADPRGARKHNEALSLRRAEAIKQIIVDAGVDAARIEVVGHGAVADLETIEDADGLAFERRVSMRFFVEQKEEGERRVAGL